MKKFMKLCSTLAIAVLMTASLSMGVSANAKSGVDIIPLTDPDYWEAQAGENFYDVLGCEGAWIDASISKAGVLTLKRTAASEVGWPRIRTLTEERMPMLDLVKYPNLYYDLTVAPDTFCQIQLTFAGVPVMMGKSIVQQTPGTTFDPGSGDMGPGTYKGSISIKKVIDDNKILGFTGKTMIPQVCIYIVDNNKSGGTVVVRSLSIGNNNANEGNGPKLDSNINGAAPGSSSASSSAAVSTAKSSVAAVSQASTAVSGVSSQASDVSVADSIVSESDTTSKTAPGLITSSDTSKASSEPASDEPSNFPIGPVIAAIIATVVVLAGGAALVYFLVIKKKLQK